MTATAADTAAAPDPVRTFIAGLPTYVAHQLSRTQLLAGLLHRATTEHGWTIDQLVAECGRNHNGAVNPAGIVMHRLEHAANHPPVTDPHRPRRVPFCSEQCRENAGWILDDNQRIVGRCPCRTPKEATA